LEPLKDRLDSSKLLRIRPYGAWRNVDVHALPWRGAPLMARIPVEYSLGTDGRARAPRDHAIGPSLVVGDPNGHLPAASAEAQNVARALERTTEVRLLLRDQATSLAVTAGVRTASRVHYAGHAFFAGEDGWQSALPLAAGGRLTVADVLALAPTP